MTRSASSNASDPTPGKVPMTVAYRPDAWSWLKSPATALFAVLLFFLIDGVTGQALAHGVAEGDKLLALATASELF